MKQARIYEQKLRKFFKRMPKSARETQGRVSRSVASQGTPEGINATRIMIEGVLQADSTAKRAEKVLQAVERECVDFNELRVAPRKDITDRIGTASTEFRGKIEIIQNVLQEIFNKTSNISLDYLAGLPKRELREVLSNMGLSEYACGYVMLMAFGHHTVAVDRNLRDALEIEGLIHPESDLAAVRTILERVIGRQKAVAAHKFLRTFVQQQAKAVAKFQKARAEEEARVQEALAEEKVSAEKASRQAARARRKLASKEAPKQVKATKTVKKAKKKVARKSGKKTSGETAKGSRPRARAKRAAPTSSRKRAKNSSTAKRKTTRKK
ncbi:MAG: hypothetical protein J7M14_05160 [Planctomycetes bacterium]|nr:hypothetical protein [Planctomycetota bacterium]